MKKKSMLELQRLEPEQYRHSAKLPLVVVLDDVRSEMNVGNIFRCSDAFAVERIMLCGITATPPKPEIHKTALGAEDTVSWQYFASVGQAIEELSRDGYTICSIEQVHNSVPLQEFDPRDDRKYAVIFGNEVKGVAQSAVDASNCCPELPQFGTKHSLNVANTAAIVIWHFLTRLKLQNP